MSAHASPLAGSNRFCSRAAAELFIRESGVEASSLTPQDAALADATPDVFHRRFTELFGGSPEHERPASRERNIVCINPVAHPYGPSSPGKSGLLFLAPGIVRLEDNYTSFHVFINMSPPMTRARDRRYRYLGAYTKVPTIRTTVEVDEWLSLPIRVSRSLPLSRTGQGFCLGVCKSYPVHISLACSAVLPGRGASSVMYRPACVPCMRGSVYARRVRRVPRPHQMRSMRG